MVNALNQLNLILLNDGPDTIMSRSGHNSVVDITLASPDIANKINRKVLEDTPGSDHFPILMEITVSQEPNDRKVNPKSRWNTRKAKWGDYEVTSERYFKDNPQLFDSLNDKYPLNKL
ncbi:hypothetical protein JTB14_019346 [Gonioctena quinquepunctata]|nr:hypothetical protein JTB14_019346 [Gonioctena quinquepunctata]